MVIGYTMWSNWSLIMNTLGIVILKMILPNADEINRILCENIRKIIIWKIIICHTYTIKDENHMEKINASLTFGGELNVDFNEFQTNLAPFNGKRSVLIYIIAHIQI
eukprot:493692_1